MKVTIILNIIYNEEKIDNLIIKSYFDLDWAGDIAIKNLILKSVFVLNGRPIS